MPKPSQPEHELESSAPDPAYTSAMRAFGGFVWGSLLTVIVGATFTALPQVPRPWLWSLLPLWLGLSGLGIALQWSVARGACPKCGYRLAVTPLGKRCPQCRSYLKAVNRQVVKL